MFTRNSPSTDAPRCAAQLFITIIVILVLGKLLTFVPVMHKLYLAKKFIAAEIIWFAAKLCSLVVFYFFSRCATQSIKEDNGNLSFLRGIALPLTALIIVIIGQSLLWDILSPFIRSTGRTVYYSSAIFLILCVSVWLVVSAYHNSSFIIDSIRKTGNFLARLIPQQRTQCPQCHNTIPKNATFCSHCGHKINKAFCCPECGDGIIAGQSYCQNCGAKLETDSETEQQK